MYIERVIKWGKWGWEKEESATDLEERKKLVKKDNIQSLTTLVCDLTLAYSHFGNATS